MANIVSSFFSGWARGLTRDVPVQVLTLALGGAVALASMDTPTKLRLMDEVNARTGGLLPLPGATTPRDQAGKAPTAAQSRAAVADAPPSAGPAGGSAAVPDIVPVNQTRVVRTAATVRALPSTESARVTVLDPNAPVKVTGLVAGGKWVRVDTGKERGFLYAELLADAVPQPAAPPLQAAPVAPKAPAQAAPVQPPAPAVAPAPTAPPPRTAVAPLPPPTDGAAVQAAAAYRRAWLENARGQRAALQGIADSVLDMCVRKGGRQGDCQRVRQHLVNLDDIAVLYPTAIPAAELARGDVIVLVPGWIGGLVVRPADSPAGAPGVMRFQGDPAEQIRDVGVRTQR